MANIQVSSFAPDAAIGGSFGFASSTIALPGTPSADSIVRVLNLGPCHIVVALGDSSVTVTQGNGVAIAAGRELYLTLGAATYIAGVAAGGPQNASTVNIATGN
jgi:hypothetical protein